MFKKKLFVFLFVLSVICSGCEMSGGLSGGSENASVKVEMREVTDADLKKTAEGLSAVYQAKPKNTSASVAQILALEELRVLVGEETDLSGLNDLSARKIGEDYFYILTEKTTANLEKFRIIKNKAEVFSFESESLANYASVISVRVIENKYTVEYVEKMFDKNLNTFVEKQRIWQDGVGEITAKYGLKSAIMPFEANGKMLFLGQKEDGWRIFYNGEMLKEKFTSINFGYCCEPALYMPKAFSYRYLVFFATQEGKQKIVEVDFGSK